MTYNSGQYEQFNPYGGDYLPPYPKAGKDPYITLLEMTAPTSMDNKTWAVKNISASAIANTLSDESEMLSTA